MKQQLPPIEVTTIATVSPSLAELLHLCALRAGLSRSTTIRSLVLGNPKAWLGSSYHEILEATGSVAGGEVEAQTEARWNRAIERQYEEAQAHPLNNRFGAPERWPGYHLIRAMALMHAKKLTSNRSSAQVRSNRLQGDSSVMRTGGREMWLTAAGGKLVGRPDKVRGNAVIDYKTGNIYEDDETGIVKASYIRQLRLYAFLVEERTGRWPTRGILLPMDGSPVEVKLDADDCQRTAAEALQMLDAYNASVEKKEGPVELASPSPEACRWCPYQLLCPAYWEASDNSWSEQNKTASLGGVATGAPQSIHGGSARSMSVQVDEGAAPLQVVNLAPLSAVTHSALQLVQEDTRIRTVGLYRRADSTLSPGLRTVIARVCDMPTVVVVAETTESAA